MFKLESDRNPIRLFAVLSFVFLSGLAFYLHFGCHWSIPTVFNLLGILSNSVGTLWIASGVYLLSTEKAHLQNGQQVRSKYAKRLSALLISASRAIPLGVVYVLLGGFSQAIVLIGGELKWF